MVDGTALWFGAAGFDVLEVADDGVELLIEVVDRPKSPLQREGPRN